ncbi:riboflavin synthase [Desulfoscipio gibsoniae]|uniref:Riboflavin synthase n=1 Tax=Desulfoscipio gibsoniae DSM 7213 TaxID=767817 RepID=R4KG75_9FIRM|nr:riboflavin synthase [Desulfoscipio gibsoniae]AGL02223.1 riboflavin synthase, alpha subunit [Desulfoscipio gibsoniae DSM 7213]
MFTGLVEEKGRLISLRRGADSARLKIKAGHIMDSVQIGDSIAVNGVCLTVTSYDVGAFTADVMAETLAKTNLGALQPGDRVNLERALRLGDRLGGHLVSGHIDGVGTISRMEKHDIATLITIAAPPVVMRYIISKGSVAVDGTSLTVVDHNDDSFTVSLIPHTARATVLGQKKPGDRVNLEGDMIGKYVERWVGIAGRNENERDKTVQRGITADLLAEHGFI